MLTPLTRNAADAKTATDEDEARGVARQALERLRLPPDTSSEPRPSPWRERCRYGAAGNVTTNVPSGPSAGVATVSGRVWAELRSVTQSAGSAPLDVVLQSSQNGVRAKVKASAGVTITGGSVRWWNFDEADQEWSPGPIEEDLQTGVQTVTTSDFRIAVGGT